MNSALIITDAKIFEKANLEKTHLARYKFRMGNSIDISFDLIREAETTISRRYGLDKICKYVENIVIANDIEHGLFEFSLLHVTMKKLDISYVSSVYFHKLHNICVNLDTKDKNIENKTMLNAVYKGLLKPYMIAFLSPQQMHPERWEQYTQKKMREDDALYNIETTDEYECDNCGERKSTVTSVQMRSADEPENKFIVCVVCGTTKIL